MKYKEKEKLWLKSIKELCKSDGWKFKGYFIYKVVGNLFFSAKFCVSLKENAISGWIAYKTLNIDNVYWDIIDEQPNKRMPLSFRGEAAFCVYGINFYEYNIYIADVFQPEVEISSLLNEINTNVEAKAKQIKSISDFRDELLEDEKRNYAGIITSLIEENRFEDALKAIERVKELEQDSELDFGENWFCVFAKKHIKNYR